MTHIPTGHVQRGLGYPELARTLLVVVAVLVFVAALNMAFGMPQTSPTYEIVPDPAGPLPF